jgi:Uma2 family endonuclease
MKTVVLGEPPPALTSLIAERKRLGLDSHDEIWNGEYHMSPAASFEHGRITAKLVLLLDEHSRTRGLELGLEFNLGEFHNHRIPDLGIHRGKPSGLWFETAAMVIEVRSPDDESYEKFDFYFAHGVEEIMIADLVTQTVCLFLRGVDAFTESTQSVLLDITVDEIRAGLNR